MLEMHGIKYISTARPGPKRGGGAAIAVRLENFTLSKLNIFIPKSVEAVWGLLRPKVIVGQVTTIIVCCFYSPPKSRKKNPALVDHMTETLQCLLSIHSKAGVIISGDRNSLEISALLSVDPALRQIVHQHTHGYKILDVIATNLVSYHNDPEIIPPINPDRPGYGVPSDHMGVSATPCKIGAPVKKVKVQKIIRPLLESLIPCFEKRFAELNFKDLSDQPVSQMVEDFQSKVNMIVNKSFLEKKIKISPYMMSHGSMKTKKFKETETTKISNPWERF